MKPDINKNLIHQEINKYEGKSSKELGIYNREEIEAKLNKLYSKISNLPELQFIRDLKEESIKENIKENLNTLTNILKIERDNLNDEEELIEKIYSIYKLRENSKYFKNIKQLNDLSPEFGVYLVGGSVRDSIKEKEPKDIDLVINKMNPLEFILKTRKKYGTYTFDRYPNADVDNMNEVELEKMIKETYGVLKFSPHDSTLGEPIDIAFPRQDSYSDSNKSVIKGIKRDVNPLTDPNLHIVSDLERRDLTINALAVDLVNGYISDPYDGIEDLVKGEIKSVGDPNERILQEDLSRGLRAIRFACVFNAKIENKTKKAIAETFKPADINSVEIIINNIDKYLSNNSKIDIEEIFNPNDFTELDIKRYTIQRITEICNQLKKALKSKEGASIEKHTKINMTNIREATRVKKGADLNLLNERINLIIDYLNKINEKDSPLTKKFADDLLEVINNPDSFLIQTHLEKLKKEVIKYDKNIRNLFQIQNEQNLPKFLQIFNDKKQLGKPRMAVSIENINKEIIKAIKSNPKKFIELLDETRGLEVLFPELASLKKIPQPREHHREGDAFTHTMMLIENLNAKSKEVYKELTGEDFGEISLGLQMAGLFHDLGKADTMEKNEKGKLTFYGHDDKSIEHINNIAKKFRLTNDLTSQINWLVNRHMFPLSDNVKTIKDSRIANKLLDDNETLTKELIILSISDVLASLPEKGKPDFTNLKILIERLNRLKLEANKTIKKSTLINGGDLIKLGFPQDKNIGTALKKITEAEMDGEINTHEDAIEIAKELKRRLDEEKNIKIAN